MNKLILAAAPLSLSLIFSPASALDAERQTVTLDGVLTGDESNMLPPGANYEFHVDLNYHQENVTTLPSLRTRIRDFNASASVAAAMPSFAYLGKTLMMLSDWTSEYCAQSSDAPERWSHIEDTSVNIEKDMQDPRYYRIDFRFSCYER